MDKGEEKKKKKKKKREEGRRKKEGDLQVWNLSMVLYGNYGCMKV